MKNVFVAGLFLLAGLLRFVNLGYSDYQGDEIKALYNPQEASSIRYFLEQRKGPMQFVVTAGLKTVTPDYRNRLLVRFPFALAGFGSVAVFYYLAKELSNQKLAFYSSIFFATNGFLIAFSRLVQYQSLVIFFGLLGIYLTALYKKNGRLGFLIWGFLSWAVSVLSHYDGVFFAFIIGGLLLNKFLGLTDRVQKLMLFKHTLISSGIFVVVTALFYIPFLVNITQSTTSYWAGRISGDVSGKISSSRYLFSVYQPIYVLHLYTLLMILGLIFTAVVIFFKLFTKLSSKIIGLVSKPTLFKAAHQDFSLAFLLSLLLWFLAPLIVMEIIIHIPGTHIYTYLIPGFLLMGVALFHIDVMIAKYIRRLSTVFNLGIWLTLAFLFLQAYFVFVDHKPEYPWQNKKFLIWTLPKPTPIFHLSMFGFPYYRHWDQIGDDIKSDRWAEFYTTNERVSISRYHIDLEKDGEKAGYYVYIMDPQTFTNDIANIRINAWVKTNPPIKSYSNLGAVVSEVYFIQ